MKIFVFCILLLNQNAADELLKVGQQAIQDGKYNRAMDIFSTLSQDTTGYASSMAHFYLGLYSHDYDSSLTHLQTYINNSSPSDSIYTYSVKRYLSLKILKNLV